MASTPAAAVTAKPPSARSSTSVTAPIRAAVSGVPARLLLAVPCLLWAWVVVPAWARRAAAAAAACSPAGWAGPVCGAVLGLVAGYCAQVPGTPIAVGPLAFSGHLPLIIAVLAIVTAGAGRDDGKDGDDQRQVTREGERTNGDGRAGYLRAVAGYKPQHRPAHRPGPAGRRAGGGRRSGPARPGGHHHPRPQQARDRQQQARWHARYRRASSEVAHGGGPVSYTHLTLPTIYSV